MTDFIPKSYGELSEMIIWHRKRSKVTQQMLADLADVSRTAVQRLESGVAPVQVDTLWKVLRVLNIKMTYSGPLMARYTESITAIPARKKSRKPKCL